MRISHNTAVFQDIRFLSGVAVLLLLLQSLGRLALLIFNWQLGADIPATDLLTAFTTGVRFDLIITAYLLAPVVVLFFLPAGLPKKLAVYFFTVAAAIITFLSVTELDFYREFHVRLNSLATQYMKEDPATVISMIWHGYPVVTYLLVIAVVVFVFHKSLLILKQHTIATQTSPFWLRAGVGTLLILLVVLSARGTLRQGPPLRWGDAFHSQYLFANHLALNGVFTLTKSIRDNESRDKSKQWMTAMPEEQAVIETHKMLAEPDLQLQPEKPLNVVLILMESFSAQFVGALQQNHQITPNFDALAKQGLLFTRFFSNGTHTHQGMFASMACFPNLPGHEYLMQQPVGDKNFNGMLGMLSDRGYQSLYVYNGDFSWDNQNGFFTRQGMQRFIGRHDFVNPVFSDPTWGVSDQDMFNRAAEELTAMPKDKPFFAFLQTLSNHTPYALPDPLPVKPVHGYANLDEHLTAMRYSDWALGQFFNKIKDQDFYKNTVFVIVGDHGFGTSQQLTEIDLLRFHVPMLILAPGIQQQYGKSSDVVGSQVDIVPTVAGILGGEPDHSCWGRNLLTLSDEGRAIIKPSGSDQTTAIIEDNTVMVRDVAHKGHLYHYALGSQPEADPINNPGMLKQLTHKLLAYIEAGLHSLYDRSKS